MSMTSFDHPRALFDNEARPDGSTVKVPLMTKRRTRYWKLRTAKMIEELRRSPLYLRGYITREVELLREAVEDVGVIPVPPTKWSGDAE